MFYILSPIPIDELKKLTPRNYPDCIDKYGNVNREEFYHTPGGQTLANFDKPIVMRYEDSLEKIKTSMFWDVIFISLIYNKDYFCYILGDKIFKDFYGTCSLQSFGNLNQCQLELEGQTKKYLTKDSISKHWTSSNEELGDMLNHFFKRVDDFIGFDIETFTLEIKGVE